MSELKPILLAEDNPKDAELTLEALADSKLANRVTLVRDGVEVLEYLRCTGKYKSRKPGHPAVVLDIKMPRMDGIEVLRAIRSDSALKLIPVVMLTSSREEQDLVQSYVLGSNAYVVKPVKFTEFVEAVKQLGIFWAILNELPQGKHVNKDSCTGKALRILHLEDSPQDAEIIRERLMDAGFSLQLDWAANEQEFTSFLQRGGYDLVLADYQLPSIEAPAALTLTRTLCPGLPFISVSGAVGEEKVVELLKQGATDYVLKDRLAKLPLAIKRALDEAREHKARHLAEEALKQLNEELEERIQQRTAELEEKNAELEQMNAIFVGRELRMVELKERIQKLERKLGEKGGNHVPQQ